MAESFYTILTKVGQAKIANATALGTKINFATLKVGDSNGTYYNPTEAQEDLVHTVWQGNINSITTDPDNPNWIFIIVPIPSDVGGFTIREVGIFDDEGYMLAVGKYPETYKPQAADGSTKEITIRTILEVSNSASVTLKIDPTVTLVTKEDLETVKNSIPQNASDIGAIASSQIGVTGGVAKQDDLTTLADDFDTHKAENETEFSSLNTRINNLNINDIEARNEIMDIKLKLKEQSAIDFINKTGVGFYDTFADNSNIDPETTASYDSENKNVDFPSIEPYTVKATSDYNDVALINVDKAVEVGDKLNNTNPVTMVTPVDSSMTYDRTTPVSVVNSAYVTSATARPQVLSNGWIVTCTYDNANSMLHFYVSKDNGATTIPLCMAQFTANCGFAITSYGTMIYGITTFDSAGCKSFRFDATTIPNVDLATISPYSTDNIVTLDTNQISFGSGCSIAVSSTGVLTAAWCSKNVTYPNSFNIRSVKSVDGGITWTKQNGTSGVDQVTADNTVGRDSTEPYVQYDKNDIPNIFTSLNNNGTYYINRRYWNGAAWNSTPGGVVYNGGNYIQSNPTATLQKYGTNAGRIWVTWCGLDIDTEFYGIKISYSDDNGSTWNTMQKFASEDTYPQTSPSITSNINGYVYVVWAGSTPPIESYKNIREVIWNGISWSSVTEITLQNINSMHYPSVCDNYYNFINPIIIWQDGENTRVAFYGKWTVPSTIYDITLTDPVTVSEGQELTFYPVEKILKMVDETFDTFNNLDLSLYPDKINKITINGDVDNSTTVITGDTDKTLTAGDKLFMNNVLNEVLNAKGYTLTMQNPVTLTDGDKVPIVDFEVQQDNQDLELDDIDTEKFVFKGGNLNTDTTSIKVLGKDNKLNAIAYAIA